MTTEHTPGPPTEWGRAFAELRGRLQLGRPEQFTEHELAFLSARYLQALYRLGVWILVAIIAGSLLLLVGLIAVENAARSGIL